MLLPQQRNVSHLVFEGLSEEEIICRLDLAINHKSIYLYKLRPKV